MWAAFTVKICWFVAVCQDLPFTYRFAYVIDGVESSLVSGEQSSNSLKGFFLPAGSGPNSTLSLVAYVTNVWGAVARGTLSPDRTSAMTVSCTRPVVSDADVVSFLQSNTDALLNTALSQGKVSTVLTNVAIMSQVLIFEFDVSLWVVFSVGERLVH